MTPSQWHDDARHRDAGHDELQFLVWQYLRCIHDRTSSYKEEKHHVELSRDGCWVERPFFSGHQIVTFADICERFSGLISYRAGFDPSMIQQYMVYEIKPQIHSVGAVIRQCVAQSQKIKSAFESWRSGGKLLVRVFPVIGDPSDPKLQLLDAMYGDAVFVWHNDKLTPARGFVLPPVDPTFRHMSNDKLRAALRIHGLGEWSGRSEAIAVLEAAISS